MFFKYLLYVVLLSIYNIYTLLHNIQQAIIIVHIKTSNILFTVCIIQVQKY